MTESEIAMIWPLPTCFKGLCLLCCVLGCVARAATVQGQITIIGGVTETVVWLSPLGGAAENAAALVTSHARMLQKDKHFSPHLLAIEVGTFVDFPNLDPIFHNAFSNFDGQLFDIGLYPPGSSRSIRFRRAGLVRVFCNIHPAMSAVIVVLATPYFTTTEKGGAFVIPNVPAGRYQLHLFHERATPETLDALSQAVEISDSPTTLKEIRISEAGYIPTPQKNKYGRDYPPESPNIYH